MASNAEETNEALRIPSCGTNSALLVVSMQNDFVLPSSPIRLPTAAAIVPLIKQAVSFAREKGALIVWVVREHHPSGRDVELFRRGKFTGVAMKGTKGAAVLDELDPQPGDHVIVKTRFSAFFGTNLHLVLQSAGIQNLIFAGIQTPNCIRQAVFDAVAYDYPSIVVLSDVTAAKKPEIHEANLYDMRMGSSMVNRSC
ncbi:hypothetical protein GOP47_0008564 [Adiantum capillus-veneris]|uniref:Isochorismatase-like domain-containing protein n=1 Tax=Adiantum capillus-veneris TaxID=13818 RepID=A0A9D4UYY3_ADICA|nr:hypothetical protein GOP47_0008564 [Adiantum capillus-veneris]